MEGSGSGASGRHRVATQRMPEQQQLFPTAQHPRSAGKRCRARIGHQCFGCFARQAVLTCSGTPLSPPPQACTLSGVSPAHQPRSARSVASCIYFIDFIPVSRPLGRQATRAAGRAEQHTLWLRSVQARSSPPTVPESHNMVYPVPLWPAESGVGSRGVDASQ